MATGYGRRSGEQQPLGAIETIAAALNVYMSNAPQLWGAVAVVIVPLTIIEFLLELVVTPSGTIILNGHLTYSTSTNTQVTGVVLVLIVGLVAGLAQLLATGAVFRLVLDGYRGRETTINDSFDYAASRLLSLIWVSLLEVFIFFLVGLLLIVPLLGLLVDLFLFPYLAVSFCLAIPVVMTEGLTGWPALRRSREIVQGRWWPTFGRLLLAGLLAAVFWIVISIINVASVLHMTSVPAYLGVNVAVSAVVTILFIPFSAAIAIVIYIDLRTRKEHIDLDSLDGSAPPTGAWPAGYHHAPRPSDPPPTFDEPSDHTPPQTLGGWPRNQPKDYYPPPRPHGPPDAPAPPADPDAPPPSDS